MIDKLSVTPYLDLTMIPEAFWQDYQQEYGKPVLPSGIVEVVSPVTACLQVYFFIFTVRKPKGQVDRFVLDKLLQQTVKKWLEKQWEQDIDYKLHHLIEEIEWVNLLKRFDILSYEVNFDSPQAFELFSGLWIHYLTEGEEDLDYPYLGELETTTETYRAYLVSLPEISIKNLGPLSETTPLIETHAEAHFGCKVNWLN